MKKTYIQPESLAVSLISEGVVAASFQMRETEVDTSAEGGQLSNKKNPIWVRDEEDSESYW